MMEISSFVVLLARQRSGTNALRSVLETHPDVFCFNEVFNFNDRDAEDPFLRETNFFNFLQKYADGDLTRILPDRHETLFLDFMEYLRCFSEKRYLVVDIKYNTTQFLTKPWTDNLTVPFLFTLLRSHQFRVLNLRRQNYLRYSVSNLKALESRVYTLSSRGSYRDQPIRLNPASLWNELEKCQDEDGLIDRFFGDKRFFLRCEYADLMQETTTEISSDFLGGFASWLGIEPTFAARTTFKKQSYLPLRETIENYAEIEDLLTGTSYEYCLQDEPLYRSLRGAPHDDEGSARITTAASGGRTR